MADTCSKRLFFCLISAHIAKSFWLKRYDCSRSRW